MSLAAKKFQDDDFLFITAGFIIRSINLFLQRKIQSYGESFSWTYTVLFNDNTIGNPIKNTSVSGL
jgi:hypothetical protein